MIQPVKMLKFKRGWLLQMVNDPKHAFKTRPKQKTIMSKQRSLQDGRYTTLDKFTFLSPLI